MLRVSHLRKLVKVVGSPPVTPIWAMRGTEVGAPIAEPSSSTETAYLNAVATGNGYNLLNGYISATPSVPALDSRTTFILAWEGLTAPDCRISALGGIGYARLAINGNTLYKEPTPGAWAQILGIPVVTGLNELVVETTSEYLRIWHNGQSIWAASVGLPAANWRNASSVGQYLGAPRFTGTIKAAALYNGALFGDVATISPLSYPLP